MGLDMYLDGERFHARCDKDRRTLEDFPLKNETLELGYWRKHPDLHGFIVQTFADGVDKCQDIDLSSVECIDRIIDAVETDSLPHTKGFFFGKSQPEDKEPTLDIFRKARDWFNRKEEGIWKSIIYRASW